MREMIMRKLQQVLFPESEYNRVPQKYFVGPETGVLYMLCGSKNLGEPIIEHVIPEIDRYGRERGAALRRTAIKDGFDMDAFRGSCFTEEAIRDLEVKYVTCAEEFLALARENLFAVQKLKEIILSGEEYEYLVRDYGLAAMEAELHMECEYYN